MCIFLSLTDKMRIDLHAYLLSCSMVSFVLDYVLLKFPLEEIQVIYYMPVNTCKVV